MKNLFTEIPYIQGNKLIIKQITQSDAAALKELVSNPNVYKYLPTFLFEKKYDDVNYVIDRLYNEYMAQSIILGIYRENEFCGIVELYGYREDIYKISVGYRLSERFWGMGIATEALKMIVDYLLNGTDIEIITASTLPENLASEKVLLNNGFIKVTHNSKEDWGYPGLTLADKWIR